MPKPDMKHNINQWDAIFKSNGLYRGEFADRGLIVNPDRDLVAVYVGYFKADDHSEVKPLPILRELLSNVFEDDVNKEVTK